MAAGPSLLQVLRALARAVPANVREDRVFARSDALLVLDQVGEHVLELLVHVTRRLVAEIEQQVGLTVILQVI